MKLAAKIIPICKGSFQEIMAYQLLSKGNTKCTADLSSASLCEEGRSRKARKLGFLRSHKLHSTRVGLCSFIHSVLVLEHLWCAWLHTHPVLTITPGVISLPTGTQAGMKLCFSVTQSNLVLKPSHPFVCRKQSFKVTLTSFWIKTEPLSSEELVRVFLLLLSLSLGKYFEFQGTPGGREVLFTNALLSTWTFTGLTFTLVCPSPQPLGFAPGMCAFTKTSELWE